MKSKVVSRAGEQRKSQRERRQNGLIFGGLAGLVFSLALWGYDSLILAGASVNLPALKLLAGLPMLVLLGGLAGWLAARFARIWPAAVIWLLAGLSAGWIALRMPFEGLSYLIGMLEPEFRGLDIYPYIPLARVNLPTLLAISGIMMAALGVMGRFASDKTVNRSVILFWVAIFLFLPSGFLLDNLINAPLRKPIEIIDRRIKSDRDAGLDGALSQEQAQEKGLVLYGVFGERIHAPYQLFQGVYAQSEISVYAEFKTIWGNCFITGEEVNACKTSLNRYLKPFVCLLAGGAENECGLILAPGSQSSLESVRENVTGADVQFAVASQRGTVIYLDVIVDQSEHTLCRLRDAGRILFEVCDLQ